MGQNERSMAHGRIKDRGGTAGDVVARETTGS